MTQISAVLYPVQSELPELLDLQGPCPSLVAGRLSSSRLFAEFNRRSSLFIAR